MMPLSLFILAAIVAVIGMIFYNTKSDAKSRLPILIGVIAIVAGLFFVPKQQLEAGTTPIVKTIFGTRAAANWQANWSTSEQQSGWLKVQVLDKHNKVVKTIKQTNTNVINVADIPDGGMGKVSETTEK